eukprot:TRINITY_DN6189_c0_g1_i1.p1 TRINITY_DN6189_c0_g1~~TRINITY_DN6189_c0_g1_i1.p1  ORF type:complete len:416 (+),score=67.03 TRINITY_DN6189_c0_g1_i1:239-1486(+)
MNMPPHDCIPEDISERQVVVAIKSRDDGVPVTLWALEHFCQAGDTLCLLHVLDPSHPQREAGPRQTSMSAAADASPSSPSLSSLSSLSSGSEPLCLYSSLQSDRKRLFVFPVSWNRPTAVSPLYGLGARPALPDPLSSPPSSPPPASPTSRWPRMSWSGPSSESAPLPSVMPAGPSTSAKPATPTGPSIPAVTAVPTGNASPAVPSERAVASAPDVRRPPGVRVTLGALASAPVPSAPATRPAKQSSRSLSSEGGLEGLLEGCGQPLQRTSLPVSAKLACSSSLEGALPAEGSHADMEQVLRALCCGTYMKYQVHAEPLIIAADEGEGLLGSEEAVGRAIVAEVKRRGAAALIMGGAPEGQGARGTRRLSRARRKLTTLFYPEAPSIGDFCQRHLTCPVIKLCMRTNSSGVKYLP